MAKVRRKKSKAGRPRKEGRAILPEDRIRNEAVDRPMTFRPRRKEPGPRVAVTPSSKLSIIEVEDRVMRAMKTLRAVPDRERRFGAVRSPWPAYVQEYIDAYDSVAAEEPRFRPTPSDISDYLHALTWVRHLDKNDWRILWSRSFGLSFGLIGEYIGRSDETVRRRYRDTLIDVWCAANNVQAGSFASVQRSG